MIDVNRQRNLASRLDTVAITIESVINSYNKALNEINKNTTNSSKVFANSLTKNIQKLKEYKQRLGTISTIIKNKASEIRQEQEAEAE